MEIRVLKYFLAVAREQSISGAAEVLHLSQPTLSRQLMDMENELGKQLFIRGNRRISLTEEGLFLRKRAEEIVDLVEKTEAEITSSEELISGDIYIGAGETDVMRLIARVAKKLQEDYPDIRYHIFSGNAEDVTEKLDKGLLDFGLLIEPTDTTKYESIKLPATDTWGVLMRKDSPLAKKDMITAKDLWELPLLCSKQIFENYPNILSKWLKKGADDLHIVATYNLLYNASVMVEEGFGYALCLDKIVKTFDNDPLCFRPLHPILEVNLDIVWKKYQIFSKAAGLFLKRLHEAFDEIV